MAKRDPMEAPPFNVDSTTIMPNPNDARLQQPFGRDVSVREAVSYDLTSHLVGILYLFVITCLILLIVSVALFGVSPPKESPEEILLGLVLITGFVFLVLRFRVSSLSETLRDGEMIRAEVVRGFHHQFFAQMLLRFRVRGELIEKTLWLPNTKRSRSLISKKNVILSFEVDSAKQPVIRNLYIR